MVQDDENNILSKADDEIIADGEVRDEEGLPAEDLPRGLRVIDYDPRRPNRLNRRQIGTLNMIFGRLADALAEDLGRELGLALDVNVLSIVQERYAPFREALPDPGVIYEIDMKPLPAPCLLMMQHHLVFSSVDRILGGTGDVDLEPRTLTDVETGIADRLVEAYLEKLGRAWEPMEKTSPAIRNRFDSPEALNVTHDDDVLAVVLLEVSAESLKLGGITFAMPFMALEERIERLENLGTAAARIPPGIEAWKTRIKDNLSQVEVGLPVILGEAEIAIGELLTLKLNDVILLDKRITDLVEMPAGNRGVIRGNVGLHGRMLALKVMDVIRHDAEDEAGRADEDQGND